MLTKCKRDGLFVYCYFSLSVPNFLVYGFLKVIFIFFFFLFEGGCDESKKPCLKNCSAIIKNSRCLAGSCTCLESYQAYYESESNLQLIECAPTAESNSNRQKLSHPATMTDDDDMMKSKLLYLPSKYG